MKNNLKDIFFNRATLNIFLSVKDGKYGNKIAKMTKSPFSNVHKVLQRFKKHELVKMKKIPHKLIIMVELTKKGEKVDSYLGKILNLIK